MPYKDPEKRREAQRRYQNAHYRRKKGYYISRAKIRAHKIKQQASDYKAERGCSVCDEKHLACLEFHHRNPRDKEFNLWDAIKRGWSFDRILVELKKCDVLCANCHRKVHWAWDQESNTVS